MRTVTAFLALLLTAAVFAQQKSAQPQNTKEIMLKMAIPASNALFDAASKEKPTAAEWAEFRQQAQTLVDAGNLLALPGMMASGPTKGKAKAGAANPAAWNKASLAMADAGKAAIKAIDKKDIDGLGLDAGDLILTSCSGCHDQFMIK